MPSQEKPSKKASINTTSKNAKLAEALSQTLILSTLKKHKPFLQNQFGVTELGLFGSYATGHARSSSDIDIVIELNTENSFQSFFGVKDFLEALFKKKVDLGLKSTLKQAIKQQVLSTIRYV